MPSYAADGRCGAQRLDIKRMNADLGVRDGFFGVCKPRDVVRVSVGDEDLRDVEATGGSSHSEKAKSGIREKIYGWCSDAPMFLGPRQKALWRLAAIHKRGLAGLAAANDVLYEGQAVSRRAMSGPSGDFHTQSSSETANETVMCDRSPDSWRGHSRHGQQSQRQRTAAISACSTRAKGCVWSR